MLLLLFIPIKGNEGYIKAPLVMDSNNSYTIAPEIYGSFLEVIYDAYSGPNGFCAQELQNRGFDFTQGVENTRPTLWETIGKANGDVAITTGGYNEKGSYGLLLRKIQKGGRIGVSQKFYTTKETDYTVYAHARSANFNGRIFVTIYSIEQNVKIAEFELGKPTKSWKKFQTEFSLSKEIKKAIIAFEIDSIGDVEIDEVSLLPNNNVYGARKEQYDLYKNWGTTIIRFPGGGIADERNSIWYDNIGDVDKRRARGTSLWSNEYSRFEFGYDEFAQFCKKLNAKPQITLNFGSATADDAKDFVEYCNGGISTPFGSMRAANGQKEPYNIQYWEVGNEQYGDWETGHTTADKYALRYNEYYDKIKSVDNSIIVMPNGDTWSSDWNKKMLSINGKKTDLLSVHWGIGLGFNSSITGDSLHRSVMRDAYFGDYWFDYFISDLRHSGLEDKVTIGKTENVFTYGSFTTYKDIRTASMQHGLWSALNLNLLIKNCDYMRLQNATVFAGLIRSGEHPVTGERVVYGGASYYVHTLYRNTMRKFMLPLEVESPTFDFNIFKSYKWLDAVASFDDDSVTIAVVNAHATDNYTVDLLFPFETYNANVYSITSDELMSYNSPEFPEKISIKKEKKAIGANYTFPAHSVTVFVFPRAKSEIVTNPATNGLEVLVQPNPVDEISYLRIKTESPSVKIILTDVLGQVLREELVHVDNGTVKIPFITRNLVKGMYYWTVETNNNKSKTMPFVVH